MFKKKLICVAMLCGALLSSAPAASIIWVSEAVDRNEDGIQDDQGWIDWLTAAGYDVNVQLNHWMTLGDEKGPNDMNDYVAQLDAGDLIIISRTASSGDYASDANEVAAWASVTTPIICLNGYFARSSRWQWVDSATVTDTLDTYMWAVDAKHPVFEDVALEDDLLDFVSPDDYAEGYQGTSVVAGLDVGNGTLIGQTLAEEIFIAEFPSGMPAYDSASVVQTGHRMLFCAGTENASTTANLFPQGAFNLTEAGTRVFANAIQYMLPRYTIIWVSEAVDRNEDGIQDDEQWVDILQAAGYGVNVQLNHWMTLGDEKGPNDMNDYVAQLNAGDLVIISRTASSGSYATDANEVAAWGSVKTPIICLNAYFARSNRWKWIDSTTIDDILDTYLWALVPDSPVFTGVTLEDDLVEFVVSEGYAEGFQGTSVIAGVDVGNGTLIGQTFADEVWIAEFPADMEAYEGAGVVQDGLRMLFCAGTENASTTTNLFPQGAFNLTEAGTQIFFNAIDDLLFNAVPDVNDVPVPVHRYTFEDGTAGDSVGTADGTLHGNAVIMDGSLVTAQQDDWMSMPGQIIDVNSFSEVTIEAWFTPTAGANTSWTMLAYFGGSTDPDPSAGLGDNGFFMTAARGDDVSRAAISVGNTDAPYSVETGVNGPEYDDGLLHHMVCTINATDIALYIDGQLQGIAALSETNHLSGVSNELALLAKGGYGSDPEWIGAIHEFRMYDVALTAGDVKALFNAGL